MVKATLTIYGTHDQGRNVQRENASGIEFSGDVGSEGWEDAVKTAVTDALKRCAADFGIGRELYGEPVEGAKGALMGEKPDPQVDHQTGEVKPVTHEDYDRALDYAETCPPEKFNAVRDRAREKFGRESFECLSITKVLDERWAKISPPTGAKA